MEATMRLPHSIRGSSDVRIRVRPFPDDLAEVRIVSLELSPGLSNSTDLPLLKIDFTPNRMQSGGESELRDVR